MERTSAKSSRNSVMPNDGISAGPQYDEAYRYQTSWALRAPAIPIQTPSVTQLLAFWIPLDNVFDRKSWVLSTEKFLIQLYDSMNVRAQADACDALHTACLKTDGNIYLFDNRYIADPARHRVAEPMGPYPNRYQSVQFRFRWGGLPIEMKFELHNEYFTIYSIIDLSISPPNGEKTKLQSRLLTALERFTGRFRERYSLTEAPSYSPAEQAAYESLYFHVWAQFYHDIVADSFEKSGGAKKLGGAFVDFRSFAVDPFDNPVKNNDAGHDTSTSERIDGARAVRAVLPFMATSELQHPGRIEHTFTLFLDGRCFYGSALGAQPPELDIVEQPLTYLAIFRNGEPGQVGRLIDNVNTLGTLRVAALRDLQHLVKAGGDLRAHEEKLEEVTKRLPSTLDAFDRDDVIIDLTKTLFNESRKVAETGTDIRGGLAYRVERSRYYREQFETLLATLRIGKNARIEGFQPYDQFVRRRLGGTYDFINMIGIRHSQLLQKLATVGQQLRMTESLRAQEQLVAQTMISLETQRQIEQQTAAAVVQSTALCKLQEGAAKGFFLIILPYYASNLSLEYLGNGQESWVIPGWLGVGLFLAHRKAIIRGLFRLLKVAGNRAAKPSLPPTIEFFRP